MKVDTSGMPSDRQRKDSPHVGNSSLKLRVEAESNLTQVGFKDVLFYISKRLVVKQLGVEVELPGTP